MQQGSPSSSRKPYNTKAKRKNNRSSSDGQKRLEGSMTSSKTRCISEIGLQADEGDQQQHN